MSEKADSLDALPAIGPAAAYEPPRLIPIGRLSDLLAGGGSLFCDGNQIATGTGTDPAMGPVGSPTQCGGE
jgi:hypothetical protein